MWVLLLGVAVHLPGLRTGLYADDYVHRVALREPGTLGAMPRWNVFDFGGVADWEPLRARFGGLPWWTSSDWKARFLRPVATLSMWLDDRLLGGSPLASHAVSLALHAGLLGAVYALYRAYGLAVRTATRALLFFALCDATMLPVGWIANRNTLLAALFTVLALLGARRSAGTRARVIPALGAALLAALSKESGVVAFPLVALELARARARETDGSVRGGLARGAALAVALAGAYLAVWVLAGYGTRSAMYVTPWNEPLRFLSALGVLFTVGALSLCGPLPFDLLVLSPGALRVAALVSLPLVVALVGWVGGRLRGHPSLVPLAAFAVLALLPEGGALPGERLLFAAAIGSSGILALFLERLGAERRGRLERGLARGLLLSLIVGSGAWLVVLSASFPGITASLRVVATSADVGPRSLGHRDVLVLQSPSALAAFGLASAWMVESGDRDVAFWPLQLGRRSVRWTRTGERAFELESLDEPFLTGMFELVYRASDDHLAAGRRWSGPLFEVEALRVEEGALWSMRVTLRAALDDPRLRFLVARDGRLVHHAPPAIGATVVLAAAPPLVSFLP